MSADSGTPPLTVGWPRSVELLPITGAAISVFDQGRRASLIHATDATAARLEEMQFDLGEGSSSMRPRPPSCGSPTHGDRAMAGFLRSAADLTVAAMFTFPLMLGAACTGTVTCYRSTPGRTRCGWAEIGASLYRAIAGPAFRRAILLAEHESPDYEAPIESRREIHQATGMVLDQLDISATDAFSHSGLRFSRIHRPRNCPRRRQPAPQFAELPEYADMRIDLRDAKAGWVMGPTNEVLRQFVGKAVLLGFEALDYWNQSYNRRAVENEVKKLDADGKRELAEKLMAEAAEMEAKAPASA